MWDEETELYYLRSRYYDAEIGRFVSADSIITDNENSYSYCLCCPINHRDMEGTYAVSVLDSPQISRQRQVASINRRKQWYRTHSSSNQKKVAPNAKMIYAKMPAINKFKGESLRPMENLATESDYDFVYEISDEHGFCVDENSDIIIKEHDGSIDYYAIVRRKGYRSPHYVIHWFTVEPSATIGDLLNAVTDSVEPYGYISNTLNYYTKVVCTVLGLTDIANKPLVKPFWSYELLS